MNEPTYGFVILQGQKIFVTVRKMQAHHWITAQTGAHPGARLEKIEKKLMKVNGARSKLLDGKALPV
jgi:hypothetical protein